MKNLFLILTLFTLVSVTLSAQDFEFRKDSDKEYSAASKFRSFNNINIALYTYIDKIERNNSFVSIILQPTDWISHPLLTIQTGAVAMIKTGSDNIISLSSFNNDGYFKLSRQECKLLFEEGIKKVLVETTHGMLNYSCSPERTSRILWSTFIFLSEGQNLK